MQALESDVYSKALLRDCAFVRTTIDLPDPLYREVKTRAVQQGVKLKDLVKTYIEAGLRGKSVTVSAVPRGTLPVAITRNSDNPQTAALTNRELNALLDEQDFGNDQRVLQRPPRES